MVSKWHLNGHDRDRDLPRNWKALRAAVRRRSGGQCEQIRPETGLRCTNAATEVHHAVHRTDHRVEALADLCAACHMEHTRREQAEGKARMRAKATHPMYREGGNPLA